MCTDHFAAKANFVLPQMLQDQRVADDNDEERDDVSGHDESHRHSFEPREAGPLADAVQVHAGGFRLVLQATVHDERDAKEGRSWRERKKSLLVGALSPVSHRGLHQG